MTTSIKFKELSPTLSLSEKLEDGLSIISVNKFKLIKGALLFESYLPKEYSDMFTQTMNFDDISDALGATRGALPHKSNSTHQKILKVVRMIGLALIPLGFLSKLNYIKQNAAWFSKGIQVTRDYQIIKLTLGYSFLIGIFENAKKALSAKETKEKVKFSAACLSKLISLSMIGARSYLTTKLDLKTVRIIRTLGISCAIIKNSIAQDTTTKKQRLEKHFKGFEIFFIKQIEKLKKAPKRLERLNKLQTQLNQLRKKLITGGKEETIIPKLNKLISEFNNPSYRVIKS